MPKTANNPIPAEGETLFVAEERIFPDIMANPGERAYDGAMIYAYRFAMPPCKAFARTT
jgi:hypothetical protein